VGKPGNPGIGHPGGITGLNVLSFGLHGITYPIKYLSQFS